MFDNHHILLESPQEVSELISKLCFLGLPALTENTMFGYQGGESADTVARKKGYMKEAQLKWRFLTNYDCSTVKNERQLADMVRTRTSISEQQAQHDVDAWTRGKQF